MIGQVSIEVVYLLRELLYKNDGLSKNNVQWKIGKPSQCVEYQAWWRTEDFPGAFWGFN